jgi:hypothetical protein
MTGGLDAGFHRNIGPGQPVPDQGENAAQAPPGHFEVHRTQQALPACISDRQRDHPLADIDSHNNGESLA